MIELGNQKINFKCFSIILFFLMFYSVLYQSYQFLSSSANYVVFLQGFTRLFFPGRKILISFQQKKNSFLGDFFPRKCDQDLGKFTTYLKMDKLSSNYWNSDSEVSKTELKPNESALIAQNFKTGEFGSGIQSRRFSMKVDDLFLQVTCEVTIDRLNLRLFLCRSNFGGKT